MFILLLLPILAFAQNKTICGEDERIPSFVKEIGRAAHPEAVTGCTVTMIGKTCAISAGHCYRDLEVVLFNTYLENAVLVAKEEDTYKVDKQSLVYVDNFEGKDWSVFRIKANHKTNFFPGVVQGQLKFSFTAKPAVGDEVTITGFGHRSSTLRGNDPQQTHTDIVSSIRGSSLGYKVDTMGGNSGASILDASGTIIGVHTHGYCGRSSGENNGTLLSASPKFQDAIRACLAWEQQNLP